ncbi:hypothetical protein ABGT15_14700 [Flavobacterium enshiense]|uniref:hypothetical protein n=1 Tax=Flavobacterium enshiense TaxID=1341165 RepID=UPI00345D2A0A
MEINLNPEESIELLIPKKKYPPLRNEDWVKIPMFFIFPFFLYFIISKSSLKELTEGFGIYFLFILIAYPFFVFIVIKNYYKRYLVAFKWKYIMTNKRLLIINHKNLIEKFFNYEDFPQIEFEENAYGNGCIIIGDKESLFAESKSLTNYRVGVNYSEEDLILYNIENVKNVYNILKSKITNYTIA